MEKFMNGYQKIGEIGLDLFLLNLCWTLFTLLGGVIFGVFPATTALYACIRHKEMYGGYKERLYKLFWKYYKQEFIKANKLGLILYLTMLVLYIDFRLLGIFNMGVMGTVAVTILTLLTVLFILLLMHLFPIYVQFEDSIFNYIKRSFILMVGKPKDTIVAAILAAIIVIVYYNLPGLIPVFGLSIFAYISFRVVLVDIFKLKKVGAEHLTESQN
ncbi:YesL family protein [Marinilactibacillus sp. GCM10026970]|uniref:YesL family protein n=1 Tax=Marinilactibacillus sp. GCM10026970 TaxID=3252642 RepID=UPI00360FCE40